MMHGDILGERARLSAGKLALVDVESGRRFTYGELNRRAVAAARGLTTSLGLAKGDRFGVLSSNRPEFLDLFFAAGKSGAVIVPLGTRLTPHELSYILADSGVAALIYSGEFADTVRALAADHPAIRWVALDEPAGAHAGHGHPEGAPAVAPWAAAVSEAADAAWPPEGWTRPGGEDLYALLYTSGTTGRPKGVMIPHRMVAWNAYNTVVGWQLRDDDVSPLYTPLYHAGGLGVFLTPLVAIGGTIVLHRAFDAGEVCRAIERERCTVVFGVPTTWKLLMEDDAFATADLSSVRWVISGGAPLPEYVAEAYQRRGLVFKQGYGLTEVGVNCFTMSVAESLEKRGSIGKPLPMTEARLVDEAGREVHDGEVGELCLRGPHVCRGYWNQPEATGAALDADGFFHTGDLARRDAEGDYYIAGRRKDMFISGGVNVYPAEIEAELLQHPSVADAAVVGAPDEQWGEVGVAFVVLRPGQHVRPDTLRAFLEARLARYKLPRAWAYVDALPRTAYGKVQKPLLEARSAEVLASREAEST